MYSTFLKFLLEAFYCELCDVDCRTSLNLAKRGMVGKSKRRRRTANGLNIFLYVSDFYISLLEPPCQGYRQKMPEICEDTVGDRPRGFLVSYWLETRWKMCPFGIHVFFSISKSANMFPIPFWHFSKKSRRSTVLKWSQRACRRISQHVAA
jgi:hypothetical protein